MSLPRPLLQISSRRRARAGLTVSELILIVTVAAIAIGGAVFSISRNNASPMVPTPTRQPAQP